MGSLACVRSVAGRLRLQGRSEKLRADWVISPQVFNSRIDLEVIRGYEEEAAGRFVAKVLADLGLT